MTNVSTRMAGIDDAEVVARFVHALLDELSDGKAPEPDTIVQSTRSVITDDSVIAVIAYSGNDPVGLMLLNECTAIYAGGRFGEISELYIHPEVRSQGVAPHLIAIALEEGRSRGWKRLEVGAPGQPRWKRTLDFYLRNGFEEVGPRLRKLI